MCLRYAFTMANFESFRERMKLEAPALKPRYNIAPTQNVPVVFNDNALAISEAKWGIFWKGGGPIHFNARAEGVGERFRNDFEHRRCLMLADSFYEWDLKKRPYRAFLKENDTFAFAGFYSNATAGRRCCMITTASNPLIAKVHERMPAILKSGSERKWLEADPQEALSMLFPYPEEGMGMFEVSSKVNSSRIDSPDMIEQKTGKGTLSEWMK